MNRPLMISDLVLLAIVDLILFLTVDEWNDVTLVSVGFIHVALVIGMLFNQVSPDGENSNIFSMSSGILSTIYLVSCILLSVLCMLFCKDVKTVAIVQIVLLVVMVFVLYYNHKVNRSTAIRDRIVRDGLADFKELQSALYEAMSHAPDRDSKIAIEKAYDASRSMTMPHAVGVGDLDRDIAQLSKAVRDSAYGGRSEDAVSKSEELVELIRTRERLVRAR